MLNAQVLVTGETWSAYDAFNLEGAAGNGLTQIANQGSNSGTWNLNSQGGKFVTNNDGEAETDGNAGTWARTISYGTALDSGKWRLELDFAEYDFTTFDGMTGVNDLTLELRDGTTSVAKLQFRLHDELDALGDAGSDGAADKTQVTISSLTDGANNSSFSGKDTNLSSVEDAVWASIAIEFDFTSGEIFLERNGTIVRGTGLGGGSETGDITFTQFTELRLSANGQWASSTADTGVLNTESFGLYTAVPEPGSFALIGGCFALASVMLRRRRA